MQDVPDRIPNVQSSRKRAWRIATNLLKHRSDVSRNRYVLYRYPTVLIFPHFLGFLQLIADRPKAINANESRGASPRRERARKGELESLEYVYTDVYFNERYWKRSRRICESPSSSLRCARL